MRWRTFQLTTITSRGYAMRRTPRSPTPGETPLQTVRRCVDTIVANARPFGRVEAVPSDLPPAELVLDVFVEAEAGPAVLSSVAGVTFAIVDGTVEIVLL